MFCRNIIQSEGRPRRGRGARAPVSYADKDSDIDMDDEEKDGCNEPPPAIEVSDADDESEGFVASEGGEDDD